MHSKHKIATIQWNVYIPRTFQLIGSDVFLFFFILWATTLQFNIVRQLILKYLRDVFVRFFSSLLYLTLNANNPDCACPSCLQDHNWKGKGKKCEHFQSKGNEHRERIVISG